MPLFCGASSAAKDFDRDEFRPELPMILNVRGKEFQVLPSMLKKRGQNRTRLEDVVQRSERSHKPERVFVDANTDRFPFILDWYTYGKAHMPSDVVPSFLNDAAYFKLPSPVIVNGTAWPLPSDDDEVQVCLTHRGASDLCYDTWSSITRDWPNFEPYKNSIIAKLHQQVYDRASQARSVKTDVECVEAPFTMRLTLSTPTNKGPGQQKWKDEDNVCNRERLNVLMSALQDHGYTCEEDPVRKRPNGTWKPLELKVGLGGKVGEKATARDASCSSSASTSSGYASSVVTYTSTSSQR